METNMVCSTHLLVPIRTPVVCHTRFCFYSAIFHFQKRCFPYPSLTHGTFLLLIIVIECETLGCRKAINPYPMNKTIKNEYDTAIVGARHFTRGHAPSTSATYHLSQQRRTSHQHYQQSEELAVSMCTSSYSTSGTALVTQST